MSKEYTRLSQGLGTIKTTQQEKSKAATGTMSAKDKVRHNYSVERDMSRVKMIPPKPAPSLYNPTTRQRVVVYCRVSTDNIEQTSSFELQKSFYLKMVRKRPEWRLVGLYADEGVSATGIEKRVGLLTMLEDARKGKFNIIICKNTSRLCRNLRDCMTIVYELRALPNPVGIFFETENMFTLDKRMEMTLQILALIAQEESRNKADASNASVRQRYSQGNFLTPASMGFDNDEEQNLVINEEEAWTVRIICMLYLSGMPVKGIIEILENLERRTKTRKLKDGTVKPGSLKWSVGSVMGIIKNEKICGDLCSQKTWTPDFLTHLPKPNNGDLPMYYTTDHHDAIISHEEYFTIQRMIEANKGAQNMEPPTLDIHEEGAFQGYVSTVPGWRGFSVEDYNRAGLRASGVDETELAELEAQAVADAEAREAEKLEANRKFKDEFQNQYYLDSDDYQQFPDVDDEELSAETYEEGCFTQRLEETRHMWDNYSVNRRGVSTYDLSRYELVRAELFSLHQKVNMLIDKGGLTFNKMCLNAFEGVEAVEVLYNPLEQAVIIKASDKANRKALQWVRFGKDKTMSRCLSHGLCDALYRNMHWNTDNKYRVIGMPFEFGNEKYLYFSLEHPITQVRLTPQMQADADGYAGIVQTENLLHAQQLADAYHAGAEDVVDARRVSRSLAIYYEEQKKRNYDGVSILEMGSEKYDAEFIREMMEKGLTPKEGWHYLDGMLRSTKRGFTILPSEMATGYGSSIYERKETVFLERLKNSGGYIQQEETPYGWTVDLDIPSRETIDEAIAQLRVASAGVR